MVPVTAREYFEQARAAQRRIDGRIAVLDAMRAREGLRAQRYDAVGHSTGTSDPTRATDARIDAESRARGEIAALNAEVEDARQVCMGIRSANPHHPFWGDAVELHWLDLMDWRGVAQALDVSTETARRAAYSALDWVDMVGIAAAREGCGQAAPF